MRLEYYPFKNKKRKKEKRKRESEPLRSRHSTLMWQLGCCIIIIILAANNFPEMQNSGGSLQQSSVMQLFLCNQYEYDSFPKKHKKKETLSGIWQCHESIVSCCSLKMKDMHFCFCFCFLFFFFGKARRQDIQYDDLNPSSISKFIFEIFTSFRIQAKCIQACTCSISNLILL